MLQQTKLIFFNRNVTINTDSFNVTTEKDFYNNELLND